MSFRLRNAAQSFQHFIDQVLWGLLFVYPYIDNFFIASTLLEEPHLREVLKRLNNHSIIIYPAKCVLGVS